MNELSPPAIGIQHSGSSPSYLKQMALRAKHSVLGEAVISTAADVGGGQGELSLILASFCTKVILLDYNPPERESLPANVVTSQADLNSKWPLEDESVDFAFSLECIEHIENPRHFMREINRIVAKGGYVLITTPNNHSLASKITFVLRGQHRFFQEASYPAHITPLFRCDFERMGAELQLEQMAWFYSNHETVPRLRWPLRIGGPVFSDVIGVLFRKRAA